MDGREISGESCFSWPDGGCLSFIEQVTVCSCAGQSQNQYIIFYSVDEQPVWLNFVVQTISRFIVSVPGGLLPHRSSASPWDRGQSVQPLTWRRWFPYWAVPA